MAVHHTYPNHTAVPPPLPPTPAVGGGIGCGQPPYRRMVPGWVWYRRTASQLA